MYFSNKETLEERLQRNDNFIRALSFLESYHNIDAWRVKDSMLQIHKKSKYSSIESGWYSTGYAEDKLSYTANQFVGHFLTCLKVPHDEIELKELFLRYEIMQGKGGNYMDLEEKAGKKGAAMAATLIDIFGSPSSTASFKSLFSLGAFFAKCEGFQNEERNAYAMAFGQNMIDYNRKESTSFLPPGNRDQIV